MNEDSEDIVCSIASFSEDEATTWRSDIEGEKPPEVGRWHSFRTQQPPIQPQLPAEIMSSLRKEVSPAAFLYFADGDPQKMAKLLHDYVPSTPQLVLRASPTPFLTGRPFTLFHKGRIHSGGMVGLALTTPPNITDRFRLSHISAISPMSVITRASGNIIHDMEGQKPAELIRKGLEDKAELSPTEWKDIRIFLGIKDAYEPNIQSGSPKLYSFYEVLSGSTSRGSVAIDISGWSLESRVCQFFALLKSPLEPLRPRLDVKSINFSLTALSGMKHRIEVASSDYDDLKVIPGSFIAYSDAGFGISIPGISHGALLNSKLLGSGATWGWYPHGNHE